MELLLEPELEPELVKVQGQVQVQVQGQVLVEFQSVGRRWPVVEVV
jgi:hypothetical protein